MKEDPLEKICEKVSQSRKNLHKKFLVMGGTRTRPSVWQTSKNPPKIRSRRSYISVAVSGSQLIKLIKSVTSLVLKKEKSLLYSAFFYEKRRLKIDIQSNYTTKSYIMRESKNFSHQLWKSNCFCDKNLKDATFSDDSFNGRRDFEYQLKT